MSDVRHPKQVMGGISLKLIQIVINDEVARQEVTQRFVVNAFQTLLCNRTFGDFCNEWRKVSRCHEV